MGEVFEENGITIAKGRWYFRKKGIYKKTFMLTLPNRRQTLTHICHSVSWEQ